MVGLNIDFDPGKFNPKTIYYMNNDPTQYYEGAAVQNRTLSNAHVKHQILLKKILPIIDNSA